MRRPILSQLDSLDREAALRGFGAPKLSDHAMRLALLNAEKAGVVWDTNGAHVWAQGPLRPRVHLEQLIRENPAAAARVASVLWLTRALAEGLA